MIGGSRKFLIILSLCTVMTSYSESDLLKIKRSSVLASSQLGNVSLFHNKNGFTVQSNDELRQIQRYDVDPQLRDVTTEQLAAFVKQDGRLIVHKIGNDYGVKMGGNLKGGGIIGANIGFYAGGFLVRFVGHGAILVAAALTGPAAPATAAALEATFLPLIESTALVASAGCAIGLAVATGPV
ncbi:MAG: hypothetical protein NT124_02660 [Candidatus Dependentiae bacterium]|nr:hypothetical protein [Candidatus Dependentiae bacterium]